MGRWVEYAGGYSDMLAQRRGEDLARSTATAKATGGRAGRESDPADTRPAAKRKLSFKEKHALESLPAVIAKLEQEMQSFSAKLADPELYRRDVKSFDAATARLAAAQAELSVAEEQMA